MPPSTQPHIRPAQPTDKAPILAFCQQTWDDEADYIPTVWDVWFADPTGHILVADHDGQPVGMTRLVQLSDTEGWWEALRIDRDFRRQGIGHQLTQSTLSLGLTTLRTCVSLSMHPFAALGLQPSRRLCRPPCRRQRGCAYSPAVAEGR